MAIKKFIRRDSGRFSKIGKNRKKLQKWRRPKGRDNKMREKRHGYPKVVSVGYKSPKKEYGKIRGKNPILVYNLSDLKKARKDSVIILGKVGAKKKLEIIKRSNELKFEIVNVRAEVGR
jgi:large subunit ribosomal protein L32e